MTEENLLSYEQAGTYLNVGRSKMYDLVGRGELPVVKIGRCARFRPQDLRDFIDARVTRKNR
jgi:excisionase family DNA binding protein